MESIANGNLYRFHNSALNISGICLGSNEAEAIETANNYMVMQFDDIRPKLRKQLNQTVVWKPSQDEDFREDYPYALAIAY